MRPLPVGLCLLALPAFAFEGLPDLHAAPLTLVVDYETTPAPASIAEMRKELDRLIRTTNLRVEWKLRDELDSGGNARDLAVVRFRGECRMATLPVIFDERGPLAFTHTSDGEILPFTEVLCENVRKAARSAMWGGDLGKGDLLLGRAMARVLAHEMLHIVAKSHEHSKDGVFKKRLSGAQLISDRFEFAPSDLQRLR